MTQWLNLARAAQLLGIRRAALQRLVHDGELEAFEGQVAVDALRKRFPDLRVVAEGDLERVAEIKTHAFARRVRERVLPSQETLALRVAEQAEALAHAHSHLTRYHDLVTRLRERLHTWLGQPATDGAPSAPLHELATLLDDGLAELLAHEAPTDSVQVMDAVLRVMTAHVTVRPSGHEFFVHGDDTLLDAALKAGLSPAYGCGSGSCGLCKARVVAGQVRQTRAADCTLSATEKAQGYTLLCAHTAITDVVLEMLEADSPADLPEQHLVATLKAVTPLTDRHLEIHLQTPRSQRLRFFAGQRVSLAASTPVGDVRGEYPIASCPCDDRNLRLHIARDDDDAFAQRLFAGALATGAAVTVSGPWGDFVLPPDCSAPLLLLALDGGYAPMASLIEHALAADHVEAMQLIWHATPAVGHYRANQCRAWAAALDSFACTLAPAADSGAAAQAALAAATTSAAPIRIFVAGPDDYVGAVASGLVAAGIDPERLRTQIC